MNKQEMYSPFPKAVVGNLNLIKKSVETPDKDTRGWNSIKAFTLIELLVVVLIIGILSAIALPQYQKAVWKSKNVQLKELIRAIAQAEKVYYLANGTYVGSTGNLDIELPLTNRTNASSNLCGLAGTNVNGTVKLGKDFAIAFTSLSNSNAKIWGLWTEGPYNCKGFTISVGSNKGLECVGIGTKEDVASFCEKVEAASFRTSTTDTTHYYSLP